MIALIRPLFETKNVTWGSELNKINRSAWVGNCWNSHGYVIGHWYTCERGVNAKIKSSKR